MSDLQDFPRIDRALKSASKRFPLGRRRKKSAVKSTGKKASPNVATTHPKPKTPKTFAVQEATPVRDAATTHLKPKTPKTFAVQEATPVRDPKPFVAKTGLFLEEHDFFQSKLTHFDMTLRDMAENVAVIEKDGSAILENALKSLRGKPTTFEATEARKPELKRTEEVEVPTVCLSPRKLAIPRIGLNGIAAKMKAVQAPSSLSQRFRRSNR